MKKIWMLILIGLTVLFYCCEDNNEDDLSVKPKLLEGRVWEPGIYYSYNTTGQQKVFEIRTNLDTVKYFFSETSGFFMQIEYGMDTLYGFGNWYDGLDNNPPSNPSTLFEYRNRVSSPGFVFDYNDTTFLGYYNFYKKEGELGKLEGLYESFLYYDQQVTGELPEENFVLKEQVLIENPNESGDFPFTYKAFNNDGSTYLVEQKTILKKDIDNETIMLVRFQNNDYIFIKLAFPDTETYFHPGLFAIKVNDI